MPGIDSTMNEFAAGKLRSGSKDGPIVTNRKQALAIALNRSKKDGEPEPDATAQVQQVPPSIAALHRRRALRR